MTLRFFVTTLAAAILSGCAAAPSAPPPCSAPAVPGQKVDELHTAFGISLGRPLAMPECPKFGSGPAATYGTPNRLCWKRSFNLQSCTPPVNGTVRIAFPALQLPVWVSGSEVTARLIEGRVEGVMITTTGVRTQHFTFDDLVAKYGTAKEKSSIKMQNRAGAFFEATLAAWSVGEVEVTFFGAIRSLDAGRVQIATPAGEKAFEDDLERLTKTPTPL